MTKPASKLREALRHTVRDHERDVLDRLTQRLTSFGSFAQLVLAKGGYRPTIRRDLTGWMGDVLARRYNETMACAGDLRTAYRG